MTVELLAYTPEPETVCGLAAQNCTKSPETMGALRGSLACGHESVIEHCLYTFRVEDVSRVLLAQLTRHRLASFSVESQRYVSQVGTNSVVPSSVTKSDKARELFLQALYQAQDAYEQLQKLGVTQEDARYILPEATCTSIVFSMNARELRHFFTLRCCNRAQQEIREMADKMLALVYPTAPTIFRNAGPGCVRGKCPEGKKCCEKPRTEEIKAVKEHAAERHNR